MGISKDSELLSLFLNEFNDISLEELNENELVVFENGNLIELNLKNREITKLPDAIGLLKNLKKLELQQNKLTEIPESIGNLIKLQYLQLSRNEITKLPDAIGKLENITNLYLSYNKIEEMPSSIKMLGKLKVLYFYHNEFKSLSLDLTYLKNLEKLTFDANPKLGQLGKSYFSRNKITILFEFIKENALDSKSQKNRNIELELKRRPLKEPRIDDLLDIIKLKEELNSNEQ